MITLRAKKNYTQDDIRALIEVIEIGSANMRCAETCERCPHSMACADLSRFYNYLYGVWIPGQVMISIPDRKFEHC